MCQLLHLIKVRIEIYISSLISFHLKILNWIKCDLEIFSDRSKCSYCQWTDVYCLRILHFTSKLKIDLDTLILSTKFVVDLLF